MGFQVHSYIDKFHCLHVSTLACRQGIRNSEACMWSFMFLVVFSGNIWYLLLCGSQELNHWCLLSWDRCWMLSTVYILMVSDKEVVCTSTKPFLLQSAWKFCCLVLYQGHIQSPPSAPRGHTMYIDGKMLSVTKYSFPIFFPVSAHALTQVQLHIPGMADICLQCSSSMKT